MELVTAIAATLLLTAFGLGVFQLATTLTTSIPASIPTTLTVIGVTVALIALIPTQ